MTIHDINEPPTYECVSYTWGNASKENLIWIGDKVIDIGYNLWTLLFYLQKETESRYIWVDQVCINQDDLDERSQQVLLMFQIYRQGQLTTAFLGDEADGSEALPELLQKIDAAHRSQEAPPHNKWSEAERIDLGLPSSDDKAWVQLRSFLSRPWFTRAWIIQEVAASSDLQIVCGYWVAPASLVLLPLMAAEFHSLLESADGEERLQNREAAHHSLYQLGAILEITMLDVSMSLLDVLELCQYTQSTDPRDRIWALLNLASDTSTLNLQPKYDTEVREVLLNVARAIVNSGLGHRLLLNARAGTSNHSLPSWVPNWTGQIFYRPDFAPTAFRVAIDERRGKDSIRAVIDDESLSVQYVPLDTVLRVREEQWASPERRYCPFVESDDRKSDLFTHDYYLSGGLEDTSGPTTAQTELGTTSRTMRDSTADGQDDALQGGRIDYMIKDILTTVDQSARYAKGTASEVVWKTLVGYVGASTQHQRWSADHLQAYMKTADLADGKPERLHALNYVDLAGIKCDSESTQSRLQQALDTLSWSDSPENLVRMIALAQEFEAGMRLLHTRYKVVHTIDGLIGMCPLATQARDLIVCLEGGETPMVVRRESGNRCQFIGSAYFHGFMSGQGMLRELEKHMDYSEMILI